jgi:hypothetical protein
MEDQLEVLRIVSERLDGARIEYMLSGSLALVHYAQPRMTRDIDLVVALQPGDHTRLLGLFEPDFYCPTSLIERAIATRGLFNLIHIEKAFKVDFVVRKDTPYRLQEFARRKQASIGGVATWIVTAEDLLLSKLIWMRDSKSELQERDLRNLIASKADLDWQYLEQAAAQLAVLPALQELRS